MTSSPEPNSDSREFRWRSFFQRSTDPLFVLNRRRRLLYVNPAFEQLSKVSAETARGLVCRATRNPKTDITPEEQIAHALSPSKDALAGRPSRVRRLLPEAGYWWEIDFFPMRDDEGVLAILGRITPLPSEASALAPVTLPEKLVQLREQILQGFGLEILQSQMPEFERILARVRLAAQVDASVLIQGEPGVGKQTLARVIHAQSPFRERSFAVLDCQRVPAQALAELLLDARMGLARQGVGTLYLREPGTMPRDLQHRLVEWIAENAPPTRARILAGCCESLASQIEAETLIEPLACLLDPIQIEIPPLRERLADLSLLIERNWHAITQGEPTRPQIEAEVWETLRSHPWPENLRELREVLTSAWVHAKKRTASDAPKAIEDADLPRNLRQARAIREKPAGESDDILPLDDLLKNAERRVIVLALHRAGGNKTRAAEMLGIWRQRLMRRMEALEIEDPE